MCLVCIKIRSRLHTPRIVNFHLQKLCREFYQQKRIFTVWDPFWVIYQVLDEELLLLVQHLYDPFPIKSYLDGNNRYWSNIMGKSFYRLIFFGREAYFLSWRGKCWKLDEAWNRVETDIGWYEQSIYQWLQGSCLCMKQKRVHWVRLCKGGFWSFEKIYGKFNNIIYSQHSKINIWR